MSICQHKWVHKETKRKSSYEGWDSKYTKIDIYYCEKCLEEKIVKKEEFSRDCPEWY